MSSCVMTVMLAGILRISSGKRGALMITSWAKQVEQAASAAMA
jgi:hypothetical protein